MGKEIESLTVEHPDAKNLKKYTGIIEKAIRVKKGRHKKKALSEAKKNLGKKFNIKSINAKDINDLRKKLKNR